MMHRGRLSLGTLPLVVLALVAMPAVASARIAYFTGSSGFAEIAAPVELSTQTANPANQVTIAAASEGSPADVAITPDGKTAYVLDNQKVVPIDVATNKAGTAIPIPQFGQSIAISPDGRFAYVTSNFAAPEEVSKIDLATGAVLATISVGHDLTGIAVTPDNHTVYVVSGTDHAVIPIDAATSAVGTPIPVGTFASGIAITPDGAAAYVLLPGEEKLLRIDVATNTVTAAIPNVPGSELAISPSGAKAYAVAGTEVTPVDLVAGSAGTPVPSSNQDSFEDVAFLPDGSRAYMTTQRFEMSSSIGLMTPILAAGDALQPTFPLNLATVRALAIVPNQPPHATFTPATNGLTASFNAGGSTDSDGTVARYDWDFGDGTTAANGGATPSHTFAKAGTYQVTVTETDNEGCSVNLVFTGQTAYCNGSAVARHTLAVKVGLETCPRVKASASTFVPKRRPAKVQPGVRVKLSTGVPAKIGVVATLIYKQGDKEATARLGTLSVNVNEWRRVRFAIPVELREELPIGTPVKVALRLETSPRGGNPCESTVVKRTLRVHVVKVDPDRVQAKRPR
jgi:DNA-binding beta-propeller fold protein YncE